MKKIFLTAFIATAAIFIAANANAVPLHRNVCNFKNINFRTSAYCKHLYEEQYGYNYPGQLFTYRQPAIVYRQPSYNRYRYNDRDDYRYNRNYNRGSYGYNRSYNRNDSRYNRGGYSSNRNYNSNRNGRNRSYSKSHRK